MVRVALDRSEPSLRFASNCIHTKSGADNLQGNGLGKGPGASQVPIRRGSQKPGSLKLWNTFFWDERTHTWLFLMDSLFVSKEHQSLRFPKGSFYRKTLSYEMTKMPLTLSDDRLHASPCVMASSHTAQSRGTSPNLLSL